MKTQLVAWGLLSMVLMSTRGALADDPSPFVEKTVAVTDSDGSVREARYLLLPPLDPQPGEKLPIVLFLHGAGERGADNRLQLKHFPVRMATPEYRERYRCYLVVPQCRVDHKWSNVDWSKSDSQKLPELASDDMLAALAAFEATLKEFPIDEQRVYLTGLSMGGYGSWDLLSRFPQRFSAAVPVCGGGDPEQAPRFKDVPIWTVHGDQDRAVPPKRSREMVAALEAAHGKIRYSELPGVGHDSWNWAYTIENGVLDWLFAQQRATSPIRQ